MFLYHGTNNQFDCFDEAFFGSAGHHENSVLGVWTSLTPALPMQFGTDVLALNIHSASMGEVSNESLLAFCDALEDYTDEQAREAYIGQRNRWRRMGYDVIAIMEVDGTIGNLIVLDTDNIEIVHRVPVSDVERLRELEEENWCDDLMARKSDFVETLSRQRKFGAGR